MNTYFLDPTTDPRWLTLVETHPAASSFHHPGWFRALQETYGYRMVVITTAPPGEALRDGLPLGLVRSVLTGRRVVSVPFADHCEPLTGDPETLQALIRAANDFARKNRCRLSEFRPVTPWSAEFAAAAGVGPGFRAILHQLNLSPDLDTLFKGFHDSSIRRNIRKAEREKLRYEAGSSDKLLDDFFALTVMTRRKHRLPPQPRAWFGKLLKTLPGIAKIHVSYHGEIPTAANFTCAFRGRYIYKYGASDPAYTNLGGTPLLFWRAIQEAKEAGYSWFDMGRTDIGHEGLATFKQRWGAEAATLEYYRCPAPTQASVGHDGIIKLLEPVFARLPDRLLIATGKLFYRHIG